MHYNPPWRGAQALAHWIDAEHVLTGAEAAGEAMINEILVSINRPELSPLGIALAAVLAIDAAPRRRRPGGAT